jgi:hypothetical protein
VPERWITWPGTLAGGSRFSKWFDIGVFLVVVELPDDRNDQRGSWVMMLLIVVVSAASWPMAASINRSLPSSASTSWSQINSCSSLIVFSNEATMALSVMGFFLI